MNRPSKGNLVQSFRYALEGLHYVLVTERNVRVHLVIALVIVLLSSYLGLSTGEWALIIVAVALVFAGEMLNTVVELSINMITTQPSPLAKRAKDVAAGAVLVAALAAAVIGFLILGPKLWQKLMIP